MSDNTITKPLLLSKCLAEGSGPRVWMMEPHPITLNGQPWAFGTASYFLIAVRGEYECTPLPEKMQPTVDSIIEWLTKPVSHSEETTLVDLLGKLQIAPVKSKDRNSYQGDKQLVCRECQRQARVAFYWRQAPVRRKSLPGYCRSGLHEMVEGNLAYRPDGQRQCLACRREAASLRARRLRAATRKPAP